MTDSAHRAGRAGHWPGDGPPDERHLQIAACFARAEDLIRRHGTKQPPLNTLEVRDLNAARTRIMHTLYVGSHGVNVAVGRHLRELEMAMATRSRLPVGESIKQTRTAYQRTTAFEQLAGAVVSGTYPAALAGAQREPAAAHRLAQALARWDIVSHRVLASSTRGADFMLVARTQALILTGSSTLLRAAAQAGHVDQAGHATRVAPAVEAAQERWEAMAGMWADLTAGADRRVPPQLAGASQEARAALHELIHDAATLATPSVIAHRTDLSRIPGLVRQALAANLDLSYAANDATKDPGLTGAARGVNTMANATRPQGQCNGHTIDNSPDVAWVAPRDLLANSAVTLPHHVRAELIGAASLLLDAAGTAMSAGMQLESTVPKNRNLGAPDSIRGRAAQDRTPAGIPPGGHAGPGCER